MDRPPGLATPWLTTRYVARTVLFGGDNRGSSLLGDTWEWDGNDWTQANDVGPGGRSGHAMAFSAPSVGATSFEVLLFGGQNGATWGSQGTLREAFRRMIQTSAGNLSRMIGRRLTQINADNTKSTGGTSPHAPLPTLANSRKPALARRLLLKTLVQAGESRNGL